MTKTKIAGAAAALVLLALALALASGRRLFEQDIDPAAATSPAITSGTATPASEAAQGFLYGRVTTSSGASYEGRLRWGGGEEAFWGDYFNGFKDENPWAADVPPERLRYSRPIEILGVEIVRRERQIDLGRPFMARFGDITRIVPSGRESRVTLKNGTAFVLDRFASDDLADGVRLWDATRGVVDLAEGRIRSIELLPTAGLTAAPDRLHGTVRRRPLVGSVTTRAGHSLRGRLVYDLDESETTETLDAPLRGIDYTIPFGLIASIVPPDPEEHPARHATVTLHSGENLQLEPAGDLGEGNAGMLIYVDGRERPEYVPWTDIERVDLDRPTAMFPPPGER